MRERIFVKLSTLVMRIISKSFEVSVIKITRCILVFWCNNIHEKISPFWLAESMSINPKQCKNLKFFECRKTKLVQKVEIKCKNLKLNWLTTGKSRNRTPLMANLIFCFQIKRMPWMAQFMAQFFADCVVRLRSFCATISNFFHIYY